MRADKVVVVGHEVVVPTPDVLLPQVVGYAADRVGECGLCLEGACVKQQGAYGARSKITHTAGCPFTWVKDYAATGQHPFKTDQAFLDALLAHLAINENFCTHDACGGMVGYHVEDCLAWMVEPYLGWVKQAGAP